MFLPALHPVSLMLASYVTVAHLSKQTLPRAHHGEPNSHFIRRFSLSPHKCPLSALGPDPGPAGRRAPQLIVLRGRCSSSPPRRQHTPLSQSPVLSILWPLSHHSVIPVIESPNWSRLCLFRKVPNSPTISATLVKF